ncbi:hypothetical protein ACWC9T_36350 [Kitasatospora sp. NPDC001159]
MVEAAESRTSTDPDRCSFTVALQAARDHLVQADGAEATGALIQQIRNALLAPRRLRVSTRKVKSPISRYNERLPDGRPDHSRAVTGLDIAILQPPEQPELPAAARPEWHIAPADRRRQRVLALFREDPGRVWSARELAQHLGDNLTSLHRQLNRWVGDGLINKPRPGRYTTAPPSPAS